ncbi:caspase family protein [Streptomyces sp. DSM 40750]|uniref:caspase family protein n=1 Tax=Streptomyces sp. DSM 40750 TaxID=2801030 RepID=UPI00214AD119|nr:caspase family protein [Streptomyces sp. DSM 40750]UUU21950.1 caspase family protein [Streptomyces sp. DSM 40750]
MPAESADSAPRRLLIATAITRYPKAPTHLRWDRPNLAQARERIVELFTGQLGYELAPVLGLDPTGDQLTQRLRAFCKSPERRPDDLIAVYIAGHGEILDDGGEHVLLTADTDPDDIEDALPTLTLARKMLLGTDVRRLMLLLDTCYSGQGGNELATSALARMSRRWGQESGSGFVVVASAQSNEQAETGAFPHLLGQAVSSLATAGHGPQALPLDTVVQQMNDHPDRPGHQRIGLTQIALTGAVPPFLPNPRHDVRLTGVDLGIQQAAEWQEHTERRETEFRTRLLVRAMGSSDPHRVGWWFSGRHQALLEITQWLEQAGPRPGRPALAITAGPGSGKTAVLGLIAALTHPDRRRAVPLDSLGLNPQILPAEDAVDVTIYAQNLTDQQVLHGIAAAAHLPAHNTPGELLEALAPLLTAHGRPLTVLVDALDEAATPDTLCSGILRPLIDHAAGRIRLLLGTRPHLLDRLGLPREQQIDLDADRYADPDALLIYTVRNLIEAHPGSPYLNCPDTLRLAIARQVAAAAGRSFLVARITAGTLAANPELPDPDDPAWRAGLPRLPGDAMHRDLAERLGDNAVRAADLLRPLAFAEGQGLPWEDLWASLAGTTSGRTYTDDDLLWLRRTAGAYVVEATEADRSAYRLYHQSLAQHLREGIDTVGIHAAFTRALLDRVPYGPDGDRDWKRAHPYTLRHLATHAAHGGLLDDLVTDPEYLVHANPDALMIHLHTVQSESARLAAAIYRASIATHRHAGVEERRQILALDAARYNTPTALAAFNSKATEHAWKPLSSSGGTLSPALRNTLTGHTEAVTAVVCTSLDGWPSAVTGSRDKTVRVWDLTTGQPVGQPMTGHTEWVEAVACTSLDGRPIAVTGSVDRTVRVWNLITGQPIGPPITGHTGAITAVACTSLDGRPIAVTGSVDRTVRVWNLTTGQPVGRPMTGHTERVCAVACTVLDGRPIAITGSWDRTARMWDLTTGRQIGSLTVPLTIRAVLAVACTKLDGRPVAVTYSDARTSRVWDLKTGQPVGRPMTGHTGSVEAAACTVLDGRPVAATVSGAMDYSAQVCDLTTGQPVGQPLTGHTSTVTGVACTVLDGRPIAVTGSLDRTVRVWDLTTGQPVGRPMTGHTAEVRAMACTVLNRRPVAVTGSWDDTMRVWDLTTGQPIGQWSGAGTHLVGALACTVLDGKPIAVSVATASTDMSVRVWDLTDGRLFGALTGHTSAVRAVACTVLAGRPIAVTGSYDRTVRVWDLANGYPVGTLTGHTEAVEAVTCTLLNGWPVAVTGSEDTTVRVWNLTTGQPIGSLTGHTSSVSAVACTVLNGRPIAVSGSLDTTVRMWDLTTGQPVGRPLTGHTERVWAVECTMLAGRPVAVTGSQDGTVRFWDLAKHDTMGVLYLPGPCGAVAVTAEGLVVCTFGNDIAIFSRTPTE